MNFPMHSLLLRMNVQRKSTGTLGKAEKYRWAREVVTLWRYLNETESLVLYSRPFLSLSTPPPPHLCFLFILSVSYPCALRPFCHSLGSSDRAVGAERIEIEK
jgi:hypothetical protein